MGVFQHKAAIALDKRGAARYDSSRLKTCLWYQIHLKTCMLFAQKNEKPGKI